MGEILVILFLIGFFAVLIAPVVLLVYLFINTKNNPNTSTGSTSTTYYKQEPSNNQVTNNYNSYAVRNASRLMQYSALCESKAAEARARGNNVVARGWAQTAARNKVYAMNELMK